MASIEELRSQHQDAIMQRDALEMEQATIEDRIRDAIRSNARGQGPRQSVTELKERQEELPVLIEDASERVAKLELALIDEEIAQSEERSKVLEPQLMNARVEAEQATRRVRDLEQEIHAEGGRFFKLLERRANAESKLTEAREPVQW